ncbi:hypothetical protein [Myroides odoratus]|uniref:hypothetical protein n=1 Tax=Myroides odoratus TaxID=256 RepID=UPI000765A5E4|nr:hypothetical protein [Myroides odoratus]
MKNFIFIFSLLFLFSCASDLEENVKLDSDQKIETLTIDDFNFKNEYVYISHMNSLTKQKGLKGKIDFEDVDYQFYSVIKTDKELPLNIKSEIEFENFIKKVTKGMLFIIL